MKRVLSPVRKCDECGHRMHGVKRVADPFAAEVNGEQWMRWLCGPCYGDRNEAA